LKRKAAALIYLKTAAWPLFGRKISSATTAVFFITAGQHSFLLKGKAIISTILF